MDAFFEDYDYAVFDYEEDSSFHLVSHLFDSDSHELFYDDLEENSRLVAESFVNSPQILNVYHSIDELLETIERSALL